MKTKLTDLAVKKLPLTPSGQTTYWDEHTPNFGIRCSSRNKSYVVLVGIKRQRKTLGRYPDLSLADARKKAKLLLSQHAIAPETQPKHEHAAVVQAYLEDCEERMRENTMKGYRLYLDGISFKGPISKITQTQVMKAIQGYTKSPSSQNYAFTTFKVFFNWAVRHQFLTHNPLAALKRPHKSSPRERVLDDGELKKMLEYCRDTNDRFTQILELLIYTGQRKGEIANLEWQDVDGDRLILPSSRTKNKREHTLPLGTHAMDLLHRIEGGTVHAFGTSTDDKPFNGFGKSATRMLTKTGINHFTQHDLRRTFATNHARMGTPVHVTERLLNHVSGTISGVAAVYNRHSYFEEMKAAMSAYDDFLDELIASKDC